MKIFIIGIITLSISTLCDSTNANEVSETDAITPELELKIHRPYPSEPRGKKYCDVWVTATRLLPEHQTKPEVEINEFKSPIGDESKVRQEVFDAISLHKVTKNFHILGKVEESELVEYRYTYFKNCTWVSDGPVKPNKSLNTDAGVEYKTFKHYNSNNLKVLNGYS